MPPHTPNSTRLSRASAPHSNITGQCRQITAALRCAAPRTKSSSGSAARHNAFDTHAMRASASVRRTVLGAGAVVALRAADRVPDTSDSPSLGPPWRRQRAGRADNAIWATLCTSVLPESHCPSKLGGQVSFAQQFNSGFFGTTVPSDHDEAPNQLVNEPILS